MDLNIPNEVSCIKWISLIWSTKGLHERLTCILLRFRTLPNSSIFQDYMQMNMVDFGQQRHQFHLLAWAQISSQMHIPYYFSSTLTYSQIQNGFLKWPGSFIQPWEHHTKRIISYPLILPKFEFSPISYFELNMMHEFFSCWINELPWASKATPPWVTSIPSISCQSIFTCHNLSPQCILFLGKSPNPLSNKRFMLQLNITNPQFAFIGRARERFPRQQVRTWFFIHTTPKKLSCLCFNELSNWVGNLE